MAIRVQGSVELGGVPVQSNETGDLVDGDGNVVLSRHGNRVHLPPNWRQVLEVARGQSEILLQTSFTEQAGKTSDGLLVRVNAVPWLAIYNAIARDPSFLSYFSKHPRKFEEFLAAAYDRAGFDEVTLTPASNDRGRDVIAVKHGVLTVRLLDQAKAYSPGHLVSHNDVRAMLGVLSADPNTSKGIVTTTSDFAPGVLNGPEFANHMPYRLETKNGKQLRDWLGAIESGRSGS